MTLDEWFNIETADLQSFVDYWTLSQEAHGTAKFPDDLDSAEWYEQYKAWMA